MHDLDGPGKRCYDGAAEITAADMRLLDAAYILNGLDPATSRTRQFSGERLAIIGHRVGHLFTESRSKMVRKFHQPGDITKAKALGQPGHDNLHQVAPMLKQLQKSCRTMLVRTRASRSRSTRRRCSSTARRRG